MISNDCRGGGKLFSYKSCKKREEEEGNKFAGRKVTTAENYIEIGSYFGMGRINRLIIKEIRNCKN